MITGKAELNHMGSEIVPIGMLGWSPPADTWADWGGVAPVRWTVDLYYAAMEAVLLYEGARMELVRGQIIQLAERPSPRYYRGIDCLKEALIPVFGERCFPTRGVLRISDDTEVEPEALVTRQVRKHYTTAHPTPEDVLLVGEVAETTHGFLLGFKARVYAQAGVPEYWVADIVDRGLFVHREPTENGYAYVERYRDGETVSPLAMPNVSITVSDLLPP